ncbi:hypothetical protein [Candidatus Hodarchaeum mangrovi]
MSKTIVQIGIIIVGFIFVSSFLIGYILMNNTNTDSISVEIVTKSINSCPENFAWFVVNISSNLPQKIPEIFISTNVSIELESKIWTQTTPSVFEVFLFPNQSHIGQTIQLKVTVGKISDIAILNVWDWGDSEQTQAYEKLAPFINYFAQNKTHFNINATTLWELSCNDAGLLIVEHYLFKSEMWELELSWHVMIPPYDWVHVYLRPRVEIKPIWGGMIESWNLSSSKVIETTPPDQIFRPQ